MRCAAAVGLLVCLGLHAQTAPTPLRFEVASVKPSAPDVPGMFVRPQPGGGLQIIGATLKHLISFAYNVREFEISGAPVWAGSDRFDIDARPERSPAGSAPADPRQIRERLQSLLAERFQLAIHREKKEQNVYALCVEKKGPKFGEARPDSGSLIRGRAGSITGQGTGMKMLALNLSSQLGRPVLDKTKLAGKYDFKLEWTPDAGLGRAADSERPADPGPSSASLFVALREQLGLRLDSQKGLVEILVIDRVEKPSEN